LPSLDDTMAGVHDIGMQRTVINPFNSKEKINIICKLDGK
jgi:hypothetical protein